MKEILIAIQEHININVPELKYIDKDWGQLQHDNPPVKFPCALLDFSNITFSQLGQLHQLADANIEIIIANLRLINSSLKNPKRNESYTVFDIIEHVHQTIHGWTDGTFSQLIRTNIQKLDASQNYEIYKLTYRTSWKSEKQNNLAAIQTTLKISLSS